MNNYNMHLKLTDGDSINVKVAAKDVEDIKKKIASDQWFSISGDNLTEMINMKNVTYIQITEASEREDQDPMNFFHFN